MIYFKTFVLSDSDVLNFNKTVYLNKAVILYTMSITKYILKLNFYSTSYGKNERRLQLYYMSLNEAILTEFYKTNPSKVLILSIC